MSFTNQRRPRRVEHIPDRRGAAGQSTLVPVGLPAATQDPQSTPGRASTPDPAGALVAPGSTSDAPISQVLWEQLVAQRAATAQLLDRHAELAELVGRMGRPAQMETVVMTPAAPTQESRERFESPVLSIGLLNPNNIPIYISGIGTASATTRSPSAPPFTFLVLPISAQMIEVAANPTDLGANTAVVFLFRFFSVQPAYLGKGA